MQWGPSCSQGRALEHRNRHRNSTVIQPLRQSAGEVVDLTVDEDGACSAVQVRARGGSWPSLSH